MIYCSKKQLTYQMIIGRECGSIMVHNLGGNCVFRVQFPVTATTFFPCGLKYWIVTKVRLARYVKFIECVQKPIKVRVLYSIQQYVAICAVTA